MVFPMTGASRDGDVTFAEPDENIGYAERAKRFYDNPPAAPGQPQFQYEGIGALPSIAGDLAHDFINNSDGMRQLFGAAERSQRLVDNINSNQLSVEEAYDRRIKAVKEATGLQLDNPERYRMTERERRQLNAQGVEPADIPNYQRRMFDEKVAAARDAHPDKTEQLTFGNIDDEAKALAKGAEGDYEEARKTSTLSTPGSLAAQFGGGFVGSLRDPLITGTMFAGPTTAAGKTVGARILSASWRQGLYNAGISALEQPSVQAWRTEVGVKSGVVPAVENVGMAFLFGAIPGAAFRAVHEIPGSLQPSVQRVLNDAPENGDIEKVIEAAQSALKEIDAGMPARQPVESRGARLGADMDAAELATRPPPPANDIPPQLHDDLTQAALRNADDPSKPSPQAVATVNAIEAWHGSPHDFEAFDLSRIGSGEGAQSYGHGLYFAERPGVAESYKGTVPNGLSPWNIKNFWTPAELPSGEGNLYKVRIHADREHMLDWDKPLSEQPQVRDAVAGLIERARANRQKPTEGLSYSSQTAIRGEGKPIDQLTGEVAHKILVRDMGDEAASKALHEAGVPGIRYLDQGSRRPVQLRQELELFKKNAPENEFEIGRMKWLEEQLANPTAPTRNFVIFDDKLIDITHKNDKPLSPIQREVEARIAEAQPQSRAEAEIAASEALEDIGNRQANVQTREELERSTLPEPPPPVEGVKPAPALSKDPLDKIPWSDGDGSPKMLSAQAAARQGEKETKFADIIRECK